MQTSPGAETLTFGFLEVSAPETTTTSEAKRKSGFPGPRRSFVGLINSDSKVRLGAFANLADKLPKDLAYPDANTIARCLLLTVWKASELDQVTKRLKNLTNCRALLQAVADVISENDKSLNRAWHADRRWARWLGSVA